VSAAHSILVHTPDAPQALILETVIGPPLPPVKIAPDKMCVLGRSSQSDVSLADESVSRKHASINCMSGSWIITDLGSRHGTTVNAAALGANQAAPLKSGDQIAIGPWIFRVRIGHTPTSTAGHRMVSMIDAAPSTSSAARERVERVQENELARINQNRLRLLMEAAASVAGAVDEQTLAHSIAKSAAEGTGFPRAFILRESGVPGESDAPGELQIVCEWPVPPEGEAGKPASHPALTFPRSLILAARKGEVVRLTSDAPMTTASIMSLGIQTAVCAPIMLGSGAASGGGSSGVSGYLYLDARTGTAGPTAGARPPNLQQDAAAFCSALAKLYAMALGNLARAELEHRQRELVRDLEAAREAQKMIMPPERAEVSGVRYAMRSRSGRYVAGDLFDALPLPDGRVAVLLGDVAGKGISAAILMATAQTHLHVSLRSGMDAAGAVSAVNRHVCRHAISSKFISLWLGIFDPKNKCVSYVDAGHGYWMLAGGEGEGARDKPYVPASGAAGGIPLGIDETFEYQALTVPIATNQRLLVFSDGIVEQPDHENHLFGLERAASAVQPSRSVDQDVEALFEAVLAYARTEDLADDTTVASVQLI
jgi:serine phosphatase RsbU (regulator of sigma subunit)